MATAVQTPCQDNRRRVVQRTAKRCTCLFQLVSSLLLFSISASASRKLTLIYVANDIIQNGKHKGPEFKGEFSKALPKAFQLLSRCTCGLRRFQVITCGARLAYQLHTSRSSEHSLAITTKEMSLHSVNFFPAHLAA